MCSSRGVRISALLSLPSITSAHVDEYWFGETFMAPLRYGLGKWPYRFMQQEMEVAAMFCGGGGGHAVLEGDARSEGLGKLEFIGTMVINVEMLSVYSHPLSRHHSNICTCPAAAASVATRDQPSTSTHTPQKSQATLLHSLQNHCNHFKHPCLATKKRNTPGTARGSSSPRLKFHHHRKQVAAAVQRPLAAAVSIVFSRSSPMSPSSPSS